MRCIQRRETDPYYNLAAEEYLLKTSEEDTFTLWRNEACVVVGKHQNTLREIDPDFVERHQLPVIRRISGGGTVYHDPGNLNFSFIFTKRKENLIDFREFTLPIIDFLNHIGLQASFEGKNNIVVQNKKVSGNAAHLYKNKVLYHGTLLFSADLKTLNDAIAGKVNHYTDKAVRSISAEVINICNLLPGKMDMGKFNELFFNFIIKRYPGAYKDDFNEDEKTAIQKLSVEKYRQFEWNYAYSPEYQFHDEWRSSEGSFSVIMKMKGGLITELKILGPVNYAPVYQTISSLLTGEKHEKNSILSKLKTLTFVDAKERQIAHEISRHLF